ncbi:glycosyltransferase family 2 protein [Roseofilum sp. BLCC_M91]|uniref:Glycosyltransferase family 2 protein n=1 Tax=Roseofilum halophilum BLCC-M91 TaxID=3022259 RepID=A0ABT7BHV2_9CYAN|nr:hypothetical protein [Roseofilum halophilum]MDJ1178159.1 glycosyltransferase family 2 protein [Roseofilum halophilum BLCC-M91]
MNTKPLLSIITPTLGKFSPYWLEQLLRIEGDIEFILIYPPGVIPSEVNDPRVRTLISPYKGEMMQRFVGLLNARGTYLLALDYDDYAHPQIINMVSTYFSRFPESVILRLKKAVIDSQETERIKSDWEPIPDLEHMPVCQSYDKGKFEGLLEVPIAPLTASFKLSYLIFPFQKTGIHFENFNNIIWKTEAIQNGMPELSKATELLGIVTWIPRSGFDRLSGLFVQATLFAPDKIIGHWLSGHEQIRFISSDPALKAARFHVVSDFLLIKYFPQYPYFWSLFLSKAYALPRTIAKYLKMKLSPK